MALHAAGQRDVGDQMGQALIIRLGHLQFVPDPFLIAFLAPARFRIMRTLNLRFPIYAPGSRKMTARSRTSYCCSQTVRKTLTSDSSLNSFGVSAAASRSSSHCPSPSLRLQFCPLTFAQAFSHTTLAVVFFPTRRYRCPCPFWFHCQYGDHCQSQRLDYQLDPVQHPHPCQHRQTIRPLPSARFEHAHFLQLL